MPERTFDIVGICEDLGSFVSREVGLLYNLQVDDRTQHVASVKALGEIQLASIQHVDLFIERGFPRAGPDELLFEVENWQNDEYFNKNFPFFVSDYREHRSHILKRLEILKYADIPLTLTHGDFSTRNIGLKTDESTASNRILFDWQFSAISHPFFDLHDMAQEKLNPEDLEEYAHLWKDFEPLGHTKLLLWIAIPLEWLLKLRVMLACAKKCQHQREDVFLGYFSDYFHTMNRAIKKFIEYAPSLDSLPTLCSMA